MRREGRLVAMKPWLVLCAVTAVGVWQLLSHYGELPDRVASHFSASGVPDGFSSKQSFLTTSCILFGSVFVFAGGLGWLLRFVPSSMINLPNRGYWLAPERRAATIGVLSRFLLWYGAATQLFLVSVLALVVEYNVDHVSTWSMGIFWVFLGGYLAYSLGSLVWLFRRFPKPPTG